MSLIKFLICAAFIKATTCAETMLFLYEDFELPEEDRNAEILFMKNIPYYPQNCEDLMSVMNVTDGWYYVKSQPKDINVYCQSKLLNEECPPTLFCNTTYGLTCDESSNKCKTKTEGNLLNEKCLNNSYCSEKYLLHCDIDTQTCMTKTDCNLLHEPCVDDSYCSEKYNLKCNRVTNVCETRRTDGNLLNENCLTDSYCNDNTYFLRCDSSQKKCVTKKDGGNLLNENCMDSEYCNKHYHLYCSNSKCQTHGNGNLIYQNCFDNTYCDHNYLLTCVSNECVTGGGNGKNQLGENCGDNRYCEDSADIYCDLTCRNGGSFDSTCSRDEDCNNKNALSCMERIDSSKQCDCDYSRKYRRQDFCVSCSVGLSSRSGLAKCYENKASTDLHGRMNYIDAFKYCKSKENSTLSLLRSTSDKKEYNAIFVNNYEYLWVNYYIRDNKFYWGDDEEIRDIPFALKYYLSIGFILAARVNQDEAVEYIAIWHSELRLFRCEYTWSYARKLAERHP